MDAILRCIELWPELIPENGYRQRIRDAPVTRFSEAVVTDVRNILNPVLRDGGFQEIDPLDELDPELEALSITKPYVYFGFSLQSVVAELDYEKLIENAEFENGVVRWPVVISQQFGDYNIHVQPQDIEGFSEYDWQRELREEILEYEIAVDWRISNVPENRRRIAQLIKMYQIRLNFRRVINNSEYRQQEIEASMAFGHADVPRIDGQRLCISCCLARCQCQ